MAEEQKPVTKTKMKSGWLVNFISFVAVICIGLSLILSKIGWFKKAAGVLNSVAQIISYVVIILVSLVFVLRKRHIAVWITWLISVALIIIYFFI